jgi:hypothetical protein
MVAYIPEASDWSPAFRSEPIEHLIRSTKLALPEEIAHQRLIEQDVRFAPILLKKSKIERLPKSRGSRCLDVSTTAMLARGDTKVRGRFCERRCDPSRRGERNASAVLKNFIRQPKRTFSTVSSVSGHSITAHSAKAVAPRRGRNEPSCNNTDRSPRGSNRYQRT